MAQEVGVRNVQELKQFGKDLKKLSEQLSATFHAAEKKMHQVCEGWNDNVNQKFMGEFSKDAKEIDQIAQRMANFSQFIGKSSEILDMYQHNKF